MNNILAAKVLKSHLNEITDGAYRTATEIAIELLFEDAVNDWHEHYSSELSLREYLGFTKEEYNCWMKGSKYEKIFSRPF